jgi:Protein of unknown function (DUF2934)
MASKKYHRVPQDVKAEILRRVKEDGIPVPQAATEEQIRRRAYELYLAHGYQEGHEAEDWLAAEKELTELSEQSASAGIAGVNYIFDTYPNASEGTVRNEYGFNIYGLDGFYSYTDPVEGPDCTIDTGCEFTENGNAIPEDSTLEGVGHTHPFGGMFSIEDSNTADDYDVPSFIGIPGTPPCIFIYPPYSLPPVTQLQGDATCQ